MSAFLFNAIQTCTTFKKIIKKKRKRKVSSEFWIIEAMQQKNFVILDVPTADAVLPMFYDSLGIYYERLSTLLI